MNSYQRHVNAFFFKFYTLGASMDNIIVEIKTNTRTFIHERVAQMSASKRIKKQNKTPRSNGARKY